MTPEENKIAELEKRIKKLEQLIAVKGNRIIITKSVVVDGVMNADRVYTQRSGSYVELTS
jgi:hypothetical protein